MKKQNKVKASCILMLILACQLSLFAATSYTEKIQRYGHGYSAPNDFTQAEINYIANNYSIFTVEKRSGYADYGDQPNTEAATIGTAIRLKAVNPDIKVLLYWNAVMSYEGLYESNEEFAKHEDWVHSVWTTGAGQSYDIYDLDNADCRAWWVNSVTKNILEGNLDGVFIDAGPKADASDLDEGLFEALDSVRANVGDDKIIIYNGYRVPTSGVLQAGPTFIEHASGVFVELFLTSPMATKEAATEMIDAVLEIEDGKMILPRCSPGWGDSETDISFSFAAFLLVYGPDSYFIANWGYDVDEGMLVDYPEYDLVTGLPLGDAVKDGWVYTREFEGLSVTVDFENRTSSIVVKDFTPEDPDDIVNILDNKSLQDLSFLQNGSELKISSSASNLYQVEAFNVLGDKLQSQSNPDGAKTMNFNLNTGVVLLKIKTIDGTVSSIRVGIQK